MAFHIFKIVCCLIVAIVATEAQCTTSSGTSQGCKLTINRETEFSCQGNTIYPTPSQPYESDYNGDRSYTITGEECMNWADSEPHSTIGGDISITTPANRPVGNKCRQFTAVKGFDPFCYTKNPKVKVEKCFEISKCKTTCASDKFYLPIAQQITKYTSKTIECRLDPREAETICPEYAFNGETKCMPWIYAAANSAKIACNNNADCQDPQVTAKTFIECCSSKMAPASPDGISNTSPVGTCHAWHASNPSGCNAQQGFVPHNTVQFELCTGACNVNVCCTNYIDNIGTYTEGEKYTGTYAFAAKNIDCLPWWEIGPTRNPKLDGHLRENYCRRIDTLNQEGCYVPGTGNPTYEPCDVTAHRTCKSWLNDASLIASFPLHRAQWIPAGSLNRICPTLTDCSPSYCGVTTPPTLQAGQVACDGTRGGIRGCDAISATTLTCVQTCSTLKKPNGQPLCGNYQFQTNGLQGQYYPLYSNRDIVCPPTGCNEELCCTNLNTPVAQLCTDEVVKTFNCTYDFQRVIPDRACGGATGALCNVANCCERFYPIWPSFHFPFVWSPEKDPSAKLPCSTVNNKRKKVIMSLDSINGFAMGYVRDLTGTGTPSGSDLNSLYTQWRSPTQPAEIHLSGEHFVNPAPFTQAITIDLWFNQPYGLNVGGVDPAGTYAILSRAQEGGFELSLTQSGKIQWCICNVPTGCNKFPTEQKTGPTQNPEVDYLCVMTTQAIDYTDYNTAWYHIVAQYDGRTIRLIVSGPNFPTVTGEIKWTDAVFSPLDVTTRSPTPKNITPCNNEQNQIGSCGTGTCINLPMTVGARGKLPINSNIGPVTFSNYLQEMRYDEIRMFNNIVLGVLDGNGPLYSSSYYFWARHDVFPIETYCGRFDGTALIAVNQQAMDMHPGRTGPGSQNRCTQLTDASSQNPYEFGSGCIDDEDCSIWPSNVAPTPPPVPAPTVASLGGPITDGIPFEYVLATFVGIVIFVMVFLCVCCNRGASVAEIRKSTADLNMRKSNVITEGSSSGSDSD